MRKHENHSAIADSEETYHCECGYGRTFPLSLDVITDHLEEEKEQQAPKPYVGVGDVVVLRSISGKYGVSHLAEVLSLQRRFGYGKYDPLMTVRYLDTDTLESNREFQALRKKDIPEPSLRVPTSTSPTPMSATS